MRECRGHQLVEAVSRPIRGGRCSRWLALVTRCALVRLIARRLLSSTATSPKLNSSLGVQYPRVAALAHFMRSRSYSYSYYPRSKTLKSRTATPPGGPDPRLCRGCRCCPTCGGYDCKMMYRT